MYTYRYRYSQLHHQIQAQLIFPKATRCTPKQSSLSSLASSRRCSSSSFTHRPHYNLTIPINLSLPSSFPPLLSPSYQTFRIHSLQQRCYASSESTIIPVDRTPNLALDSIPNLPSPPPYPPILLKTIDDVQEMLVNDIGGASIWAERASRIKIDSQSQRKGRLAVIGDTWSCPRDVVSALIQDPLLDTQSTRTSILERYTGSNNDVLTLSHSSKIARSDRLLQCPSSWLQTSGYDVVEIQLNDHEANATEIMACDAVLIVLDPIRIMSVPSIIRLLPFITSRKTVRIAINGSVPSCSSQSKILDELRSSFKDCPPTFFIESNKALQAFTALSEAFSHPSVRQSNAFEVFQTNFLESRMGPLQTALATALLPNFQMDTTVKNVQLILQYISTVLASDEKVLQSAIDVVGELRKQASQAAERKRNSSVVSKVIDGAMVEGSVQHNLKTSQLHLQRLFATRLSWLSLLARLRVDDVGAELGSYVSLSLGKDLEEHLIYEAGQLYELQTNLSSAADNVVRKMTTGSPDAPGHPFSSPLLLNHLRSLSVSIPPVTPKILLSPFITRRRQLIDIVIPRIQRSAQKITLSTYSTMILGVSGSWILAVLPVVSGVTATGLAIVSVLFSLLLGQNLWARAQAKFWKDFKRVMHLTRDDLMSQYQSVLDVMVVAKPSVAAKGLDELICRRQSRLGNLQERLQALQEHIK